MTYKLLITISPTADLIITEQGRIAIAPGVASNAQEAIEIGPLNDESLEHLAFAIQRMRTFA